MNKAMIINYILNSISVLITLFIFTISIIRKLHNKFLTELMLYILFAEIINELSKYLSFFWNDCFDKPGSHEKCVFITLPGNIQIYLNIFSDILSVTTGVVISFYSYDILKSKSKVFNSKQSEITIRVILFSLSLMTPAIFSFLQIQYYQFYSNKEHHHINSGRCLIVDCVIAADLELALLGIIFGCCISAIFISCFNWRILKTQSKRITKDEKREKKEEILTKIKKAQWRIMLFPLVSSVLFILYHIDPLIKCFIRENYLDYRSMMDVTGIVYAISNGIKGSVFSGLVMFTISDILKGVRKFFKRKQRNKGIVYNEVEDQSKWT